MLTVLIDNVQSAEESCKELREEKLLGFDCEGLKLGLNGVLTLAQVSTASKVYLFDVHTCPEVLTSLQGILESDTILKIIHDCRGERSNLQAQFGISLRNVFDTQIAYHFKHPRKNNRIGLFVLSRDYGLPMNPVKAKFNTDFYNEHPQFWAERPLTQDMIQYASSDVSNLIFLYGRLRQFCENNTQFRRMCENATLTADDYEDDGIRHRGHLRFINQSMH